MRFFKAKIFQRQVGSSALAFKLLRLIFLLTLATTVLTPKLEAGDLVAHFRVELLAEIEKSLPDVEELSFTDSGDVVKWVEGYATEASLAILQVGCWNRKNGVLPVQLELKADDGKEARRWFKITVNGKERVLQAGRDLVRGEPVRSSDFVSTLVDCRNVSQEAVKFIPEDMIYQLTANLQIGAPLKSRRLQPYRLIKRGDLIQVFLQYNGVTINTRGVAMGNGTLKEVITVKNPTSRKYYQAQVVGSGEVVVVY